NCMNPEVEHPTTTATSAAFGKVQAKNGSRGPGGGAIRIPNMKHILQSALFLFTAALGAAPLDFKGAAIVIPADASTPERKAAAMLSEEIEKRTQLRLKIQTTQPASGPAFVLGRA